MDLLQECAAGFERLLPYQYHIVAGRKGKHWSLPFLLIGRTSITWQAYINWQTISAFWPAGGRILCRRFYPVSWHSPRHNRAYFSNRWSHDWSHLSIWRNFWPSAQGMIPRCAALSSQKRRRTMLRASRATHYWRKKKSTSSLEKSPFSMIGSLPKQQNHNHPFHGWFAPEL